MKIVHALLLSFFLTELIEITFSLIFGVRKKGLLVVFLVNLLTNPCVVFLYYLFSYLLGIKYPLLFQIILEIFVVLIETLVYNAFRGDSAFYIKRPVLLGVLLNVISYGIGLFLNYFVL